MAELVQSVAKAATILGVFNRMNRLLTVREISAKTGIPRSTVHEICRTLVASNLLESRPDGGLQLGIGLAMLGGQVIERQGLVDAAQQPIQRHLDRFGVEVHVAAYIPGAVFYAYRKRAATRVATMNRTGRRWDINSSACGRAVLATMGKAARDRELAPLVTSEEREQLEAELDVYARHGFVVTDVSQPGLRSVAAPVFDVSGLAIGAIGTADVVGSMTRQRITEIGEALRQACIETSRTMGWTGSVTGREPSE